jgi:hypothetical protein
MNDIANTFEIDTGTLDVLLANEGLADKLKFPHNHSDIAWSHFLAQHVGKLNTENFVRAFYKPLNELDNALNDLYTKRWLDTAEGIQLDGIGSIVGISRSVANAIYIPFFGFSSQIAGRAFGVARMRRKREPYAQSIILGDVEYRILINMKIALNNGHGTAEELIRAFDTALNVTGTTIMDAGNANARVYINDFIMSYDPRSELLNYMIPKAAGVKLWPYYYDADYIFGFSNQNMGYYGFDIGILARRPGSNIPPMVITISIWDRGESVYDSGNSLWDQKGVPE